MHRQRPVPERRHCVGQSIARPNSCERCREYPDGAGKVPPLRLIVSAGRPISPVHRREDWSRLEGQFHWIERAVIASRLGSLKLDLPGSAQSGTAPSGSPASATTPSASQQAPEVIPDKEMNLRMRENMIAALQHSGGRVYGPGGAAELLGLRPSTLNTRINKLGLK
jgi:hypothetical protein